MKNNSDHLKHLVIDFLNCKEKILVRDAHNRQVYRFSDTNGQGYYIKLYTSGLISKIKVIHEVKYHNYLIKRGVALPQIIGSTIFIDCDGKKKIVVFSKEADGIPLTESNICNDPHKFLDIFHLLIKFLADNYKKGIMHNDLHLGNILWDESKKKFIFVDSKKIKYKYFLNNKEIIKNFSLLFLAFDKMPWFNLSIWNKFLNLFFGQCGVDNKYMFYAEQVRMLLFKKWIKKRTDRCFRENTDFSVYKRNGVYGICQKKFNSFNGQNNIFEYLGAIFESDKTKFIKNSNTTAVVKLNIAGKEVVVKKFKVKRVFDPLKNIFRKSRGYRCWKWSWMLNLNKFPVPEPLFFFEKRKFGLLKESYFAAEFCSQTKTVTDYINTKEHFNRTSFINSFAQFLNEFIENDLCHNDFQLKNILVKEDNGKYNFYLIDLESIGGKIKNRDKKVWFYLKYLKKSFLRLKNPSLFTNREIILFVRKIMFNIKPNHNKILGFMHKNG